MFDNDTVIIHSTITYSTFIRYYVNQVKLYAQFFLEFMCNIEYLTNMKAPALKFKIFLTVLKRLKFKENLRINTIYILVITVMFYGKIVR